MGSLRRFTGRNFGFRGLDMVMSATSLSGHGLRDWLIQRVSAYFLAVYIIGLLFFVIMNSPLDYTTWSALFDHIGMKVASSIAILTVVLHAWIGIWTVLTDYVNPAWFRLIVHFLVVAVLLGCLIWGLAIFWSY